MADFEKSIPHVLKWEGGYVDHPADPGGATNRGIIFTLFKQFADELGLPKTKEGLKQLTEGQAKHIYRIQFWNKMKGDLIKDQRVADIIFDGFVNMGKNGLKVAQKEAGVEVDGEFGPKTIEAINNAAPKLLFEGIKDGRIAYYKRLAEKKPPMQVFLKGWLNRISSFNYV
jgi:lysozyme family protein